MTDEEAMELGRRYLAAGGTWMPGMLFFVPWCPTKDGEFRYSSEHRSRDQRTAEKHNTLDISYPDFRDPATFGCLMHLAEQAAINQYGATFAWIGYDDLDECWQLYCEGSGCWTCFESDSRLECALKILEAAP